MIMNKRGIFYVQNISVDLEHFIRSIIFISIILFHNNKQQHLQLFKLLYKLFSILYKKIISIRDDSLIKHFYHFFPIFLYFDILCHFYISRILFVYAFIRYFSILSFIYHGGKLFSDEMIFVHEHTNGCFLSHTHSCSIFAARIFI